VAAQTTMAPSIGCSRAEPCPDRTLEAGRSAVGSHHPGELALSPARGNASQPEDAGQAKVVIIPAMAWDELTDEALIARYRDEADKNTAQQYVNELFKRHHVKVARWCLSFAPDRETAADLAQEICAKAYQKLDLFKGDSKFSTWLFSIARNHCLNNVRSRSNAPVMETDEAVMETLPDLVSDNPQKAAERNQLAGLAKQLINDTLEETEKTVFTLHYAEEVPLDVITRMLKLDNASGAKAYLVSAKRKLDKAVKRWNAAQ
jgi:RNA polymerase sigma-70 factor, ECF subfamily